MLEADIEKRVAKFREFMVLPNGIPVASRTEAEFLLEHKFFMAPASSKYHGAYEGGLFDHSLAVAEHLVRLTKQCNLHWQAERSPYIIGMFHDLCKTDQYRHPSRRGERNYAEMPFDLDKWEYVPDTLLKGHGDKSVMLLSQLYILTEEEIACIRYHMGAFTPQEEWNSFTNAIHVWPNVLWTHQADMLASHVDGV